MAQPLNVLFIQRVDVVFVKLLEAVGGVSIMVHTLPEVRGVMQELLWGLNGYLKTCQVCGRQFNYLKIYKSHFIG